MLSLLCWCSLSLTSSHRIQVEEAPPQSIVKEGDEMNEGGDKSPSTLVGTAPASRIATSSTGHAPVDSVDTQQAAEPVRAAQVIKTSLFRVFNFSSCFDQLSSCFFMCIFTYFKNLG